MSITKDEILEILNGHDDLEEAAIELCDMFEDIEKEAYNDGYIEGEADGQESADESAREEIEQYLRDEAAKKAKRDRLIDRFESRYFDGSLWRAYDSKTQTFNDFYHEEGDAKSLVDWLNKVWADG